MAVARNSGRLHCPHAGADGELFRIVRRGGSHEGLEPGVRRGYVDRVWIPGKHASSHSRRRRNSTP